MRFVTLLQFCRQRRHFSPSKHARTHSTVFFACAGRPSWPRSAGIVACASLLTTIVLSDFFFSFLKDNEQRHNRHGRVSSSWHCSSCTSSKKSVQFESRAASVDVKHMEAVSKLEEAQQHSRNAKKLELQFSNRVTNCTLMGKTGEPLCVLLPATNQMVTAPPPSPSLFVFILLSS